MKITHVFEQWLSAERPDGYQEVYSLYKAVKDRSSFGIYEVKPAKGRGDRWIVNSMNSDQGLLLASNDARGAFLLHLSETYCERDLDVESWYSYKHSMDKGD
jgi:hypothetical protein